MNTLHPVPPTSCETTPAPWLLPVQEDLFGQTLLQALGLDPKTTPDKCRVTNPTHLGNFLEGLLAVRVGAIPAPCWVTVFVCCRQERGRLVWHSGIAGGLAFGPSVQDRRFYFHGCPNLDAPSATLDAAVRHALAEARDMLAGYHGFQDQSCVTAAHTITNLLRMA